VAVAGGTSNRLAAFSPSCEFWGVRPYTSVVGGGSRGGGTEDGDASGSPPSNVCGGGREGSRKGVCGRGGGGTREGGSGGVFVLGASGAVGYVSVWVDTAVVVGGGGAVFCSST
jgi:hypothetical protein